MAAVEPRPTPPKEFTELEHEWDRIASTRADQIETGKDLSFTYVLVPSVLQLLEEADKSLLLDAGCGAGFLSSRLAQDAGHVVGVDMSSVNINLARKRHQSPNISFVHSTVEAYASPTNERRFTCAVSNMGLMTAPKLSTFLAAISQLLRPEGCFVATLTHPWFWPRYWQYETAPWFRYDAEIFIEAPFRISLDTDQPLITTHIHRPLATYIDELRRARFTIEAILEPQPPADIRALYTGEWDFPRFLALRCIRRGVLEN